MEDLRDQGQHARGDEKLFHWTASAAREIFSDRVKNTGFPAGLFSYHSLRSGFLCSALLKAGSQKEREAVLEHTALVAGWKVGSSSQLVYIKEAFLRQISCCSLVAGEEKLFLQNADSTTTFHHIAEPVSVWGRITSWDYFQARAMRCIRELYQKSGKKAYQSLFRRLMEHYIRMHDNLLQFQFLFQGNAKPKATIFKETFRTYILGLNSIEELEDKLKEFR